MFGYLWKQGRRRRLQLAQRDEQAERALQAVQALGDELRLANTIFEQTQPVLVTDARARIQRVNEALCQLMGYRPEEMLGQTPRMFRSNHHDQAFYDQMVATIKASGHWAGEVWDRRKSGEVFPKWMSITAVSNAAGEVTHMVACYTDLSAQQKIHQLAFYDVLTGLPNRTLLRERLQLAQEEARRSQHWGALLLLDWDDFKSLNDSLGHSQGDGLLRHIGQLLRAALPSEATAARLGGDEFAILLPQLARSQEQAAALAESLAERLLQSLGAPYCAAQDMQQPQYQGSASLGLTLFAGSTGDADVLLRQAELAMYQAKQSGRGLLHFFDEALERQVMERMLMERALRVGIARGELQLHYQPQIALDSDGFRVVGAEALVRWQHPERGLVSPGLFIPLAEETGLIEPLGHWVLQAACAQLGRWRQQGGIWADLTLAVNVSAAQFLQQDFIGQVLQLLHRNDVPPERLKLELTESLLVHNPEDVIATMTALRARGVRFSLDDFGTGYSSLQYLRRLPLHQLKIDQSFVRDLESDASNATIAQAVAALGHSLGLAVIAEGVETAAQQRLLASMGCTLYQGYWFSRPLPLAGFEAYCAAGVRFD